MVIAAPAWLVIPAMVTRRTDRWTERIAKMMAATGAAGAAFAATNPFLIWNFWSNPRLLGSNVGTTVGMYSAGRLWEGLWNVGALSVEAAGVAVLAAGAIGAAWVWRVRPSRRWVVLAPGLAVLGAMAVVGAGKPGEYARFGIPAYAMLAVLAAVAAARLTARRQIGRASCRERV